MSEPVWLECPDPGSIPEPEEIRRSISPERHLVLLLPDTCVSGPKQELVERLAAQLPECAVFDGGSRGAQECITVLLMATEEDLLAHEEEFTHAAREFRRIASTVMAALARKLGVTTLQLSGRYFRPDHAARARGEVDDQWSYWFHGCECCLGNRATGQVLGVCLGFPEEFGVLDPWFFHRFLETTPAFEHLARLLPQEYHDSAKLLLLLEERGHLRRVVGEEGAHRTLAAR